MSSIWQHATIADVAVVDWGNTSLTKKAYVAEGPFLGVSAAGCDGRMNHAEHRKNTPVISAIGAQCGRMFLPREDFTAIKNTITLTPIEHVINPFFLYHFLTYKNLPKRGAGQPFISKGDVQKFPISLPPLEEQRRIVAILDEAFDGLDRARANAQANLQNAQEFFLSALRDVFRNNSGKWQTDMPADTRPAVSGVAGRRSRSVTRTGGRGATLRPIPGPFSLSVLEPSGQPRPGWRWTGLTDLARLESGHTPSRKHPEYWGGEVPWIGIKDARDHHGGTINETLENTNALGIANSSARILPKDTVCLSRTASVGYVTVMGREMATSQDFVNWVCGPVLIPQFLKLLLLAQDDDIRRFASGSVHQTIYFPEVKAFHICHPPVTVQREICSYLDGIRQESERLISNYEQKVSDLGDLRQSLLERAFAGELA